MAVWCQEACFPQTCPVYLLAWLLFVLFNCSSACKCVGLIRLLLLRLPFFTLSRTFQLSLSPLPLSLIMFVSVSVGLWVGGYRCDTFPSSLALSSNPPSLCEHKDTCCPPPLTLSVTLARAICHRTSRLYLLPHVTKEACC